LPTLAEKIIDVLKKGVKRAVLTTHLNSEETNNNFKRRLY